MKALGYFVVIKKQAQTRTMVGNIEITETQDDTIRFVDGEILSVGNAIEGLKVGDLVKFDKRAAHEDGEENLIIKSDSIAYIK
jgi:hypothetical protein